MRTPTRSSAEIPTPTSATASAAVASLTNRDAESLFRTKPIEEIRSVEYQAKKEIEERKEELRQLVGQSYRDLIESADSIISMKSSCQSLEDNLSSIESAIVSLSPSENLTAVGPSLSPNPARAKIYGIACRVKYLVDTPENIWGCLDESMLLEASGRYLRAKDVHGLVSSLGMGADLDVLAKFPLLKHQWQIVESFKAQISQRSRERLMGRGLTVGAYADALSAAATIDDLSPKQVLELFLYSRRSWISQRFAAFGADPDSSSSPSTVLCEIVRIIRASLGQVGEMFLLVLSEMPLFYKLVLGSPPGTQLFGGIPNPEEEVRLWKSHREKLESAMVLLEPEFIAQSCWSWLKSCCQEIFGDIANGKKLMDSIRSGDELASVERLVREALDGRDGLEGSLEQWLRSVFGSEIESPWDQIRGLVLKEGKDILEERLEEAFVRRMKEIVLSGFSDLKKGINIRDSIEAIFAGPSCQNDFQCYLKKRSTDGDVWFSEPNHRKTPLSYSFKPTAEENGFKTCLNSYFGSEISRIRDTVDGKCGVILEDLLSFVESHNSTLRLRELAPYLQDNCFRTITVILKELEDELGKLSASLEDYMADKDSRPPSVLVERSLFIGRLLFAFRNNSNQITMILGSPRGWVKETAAMAFPNLASLSKQSKGAFDSPITFSPRRHTFDSPKSPGKQFHDSPRRQTLSAAAALFTVDDNKKSELEELNKNLQDLCIRAHSLWITWVSNELSMILTQQLNNDDALSLSAPFRDWEVTGIKQASSEGSTEMKISLPFMPSLYIISFLFKACLEIHKVGGHVLDKSILRNLSCRLLQKVIGIYEKFLSIVEEPHSRVSEKGVLQILLDIRFSADILSGGKDFSSDISQPYAKMESSKNSSLKPPFRRKQLQGSATNDPVFGLIRRLSQQLDPIDWATYEPFLWENEKQSYKRFDVLFGFLVQLNHMYTNTVQKLPTRSNTDSNILRCSTVPRFKYLPISIPALSSRGQHKSALQTSPDDASTRSPWKAYMNGELTTRGEFDDSLSAGGATPLFKSLMTQVGSKFGESTSLWGSMLSDGQVGKLKDRSAAAMSTFGDMLPGPAAGLLSSFTSGATRYDS